VSIYLRLFLLSCILVLAPVSFANDNQLTAQIENHYQLSQGERDYGQIQDLLNQYQSQLISLPEQIRAKAFLLAADMHIEKGNSNGALEYATKVSELANLPIHLQVKMLLNFARGAYASGRFEFMQNQSAKAAQLALSLSDTQSQVIALSYQAIASASLYDPQQTQQLLTQITTLAKKHPELCEHGKIIENLALIHNLSGDYNNALSLQLKLIAIREQQVRNKDLDRAYYNLGSIYRKLERFDDAYNAYWGSKNYASSNGEPLKIAYAELGMGEVLIAQKKYQQAHNQLTKVVTIFQGQKLTKPYLQSLIALAEASLHTGNQLNALQLLIQSKDLIADTQLVALKAKIYKLLSQTYAQKQDYSKAYQALAVTARDQSAGTNSGSKH
jgi:tetratricopeptide (TPR) repeat protein